MLFVVEMDGLYPFVKRYDLPEVLVQNFDLYFKCVHRPLYIAISSKNYGFLGGMIIRSVPQNMICFHQPPLCINMQMGTS